MAITTQSRLTLAATDRTTGIVLDVGYAERASVGCVQKKGRVCNVPGTGER